MTRSIMGRHPLVNLTKMRGHKGRGTVDAGQG